jgi:hypothetical protein
MARSGGNGITFHAEVYLTAIKGMARPQLDKPVALALSDTAKTAKTKAAQLIARRTGLASATVKSRILHDWVPIGAYQVEVHSSRKPISLGSLPRVRQNSAGVAINVWGKSQTLVGAFIRRGQVFRRRGSSRLLIRKLWGPTIAGTFATPEVQGVVKTAMQTRLRTSLMRRVAAAIRRR